MFPCFNLLFFSHYYSSTASKLLLSFHSFTSDLAILSSFLFLFFLTLTLSSTFWSVSRRFISFRHFRFLVTLANSTRFISRHSLPPLPPGLSLFIPLSSSFRNLSHSLFKRFQRVNCRTSLKSVLNSIGLKLRSHWGPHVSLYYFRFLLSYSNVAKNNNEEISITMFTATTAATATNDSCSSMALILSFP